MRYGHLYLRRDTSQVFARREWGSIEITIALNGRKKPIHSEHRALPTNLECSKVKNAVVRLSGGHSTVVHGQEANKDSLKESRHKFCESLKKYKTI
jgi:hypothetical protein